jgi:peroxiredoxin family protein
MDMMKLEKDDLYEGVDEVIGAMDFMEVSEGGQIIFI